LDDLPQRFLLRSAGGSLSNSCQRCVIMAIRIQTGRKSPFVVYWTNPFTGKSESKAFSIAEDAEKHDAFIKYQLKYERDSFRRTEEPQQVKANTLESVLYLYLKEKQMEVQNLERTLLAVKGILSRFGDYELPQLDVQCLQEMKGWLTTTGNKWATIRRKMGIVKAVLRWAYRNGSLESLPLFPVLPQSQHARYVPPTQEEVNMLYRVAPEHMRRVIILGYHFGMRVGQSELLKLCWKDVDLISGVVRVPNANKGATEMWREVPIRDDLLPILRQWLAADAEKGMEHVITYRGKPVKSIKTAWKGALRIAGITRHIRPYDLRHGFATEAIAADVDVGTVATLMGHSSPSMVWKHYQHVRDSQKKAAVEALPSPPKPVQNDLYKN